ncbi:hypothetical protein J2W79_003927 [Methylorubrum extorquens]|nr:hypothetical protein [Methylorubrum extorquens]
MLCASGRRRWPRRLERPVDRRHGSFERRGDHRNGPSAGRVRPHRRNSRVIRKKCFSAIAIPASHLSGIGGPALGLLEGPAEPGDPVSGHSAREGSEALEIACARNPVGRRDLLPVGGGACRGDGCRLCQSSVAHRRGGSTATLPRRKHSRAVRLVDVAHRVALLASDYSGSAQRTRARCSCSGHVRGERGDGAGPVFRRGGATKAAMFHGATSAPPGADRTGLGQNPLGAVEYRSLADSRIAPGDGIVLPARTDRVRFARSDAHLEGRAATAPFVIGGLQLLVVVEASDAWADPVERFVRNGCDEAEAFALPEPHRAEPREVPVQSQESMPAAPHSSDRSHSRSK